jgi:hypothetical protein
LHAPRCQRSYAITFTFTFTFTFTVTVAVSVTFTIAITVADTDTGPCAELVWTEISSVRECDGRVQ